MKCPVCDNVSMREVEKEGVLIDICPSCKGVWLDRGELDKLLQGVRELREPFNRWYESYGHEHYDPVHYPKHKKKKNIFDLFAIFD